MRDDALKVLKRSNCRHENVAMSLGTIKLGHMRGQYIRGTLVHKRSHQWQSKVENERNEWFAEVQSQIQGNFTGSVVSTD